MVPPRAPDPGQRLRPRGASRLGGRWAPRGWAPGAAAGLCLRACRPPCPLLRPLPGADQTVSAAPEPGCGGGGGGGRRASGGAGRGRAEDGVTWAGPVGRDTPRGRAGAAAAVAAQARGTGLLRGPPRPGASEDWGPERAPGTLGCAPPGLTRREARRPSCPVPARALGTGGHSSPSPPLWALQRRPGRPPHPPHPPPASRSPDPGPTVADGLSAAPARALSVACTPDAPGRAPWSSVPPGRPPPGPSLPPGWRVLRPSPSLALTSLRPSGSWTGPPQLRAARDSGASLRESEALLLASRRIWARPRQQSLDQAPTSPSLRFLI
ncbi:basic proline-rich protein-like [Choloepus didactylus]|uniref:basic proline-rich protein-like n=1 Tax=Choloepus didactylus TaxID=27675 RepID=UPI00189E6125|nr:basic proline-rich protein-like [Choloepus didactylus]